MTITADNRPQQRDREGKLLKNIAKTRLYHIWNSMYIRCYDQNAINYHSYGAKGITVCYEWHKDNPNGFDNFRTWSLQNGYTEDLTIDRIDSNGNYEPLNCRWISNKEQQRNKGDNRPIILNGKEYRTISEAIEALGREEDYNAIYSRIYHHGYTPERAFSEPIAEHTNPITVNGQTFPSVAEACRALNLNRCTVISYKRKHNTTYEQTIAYYLEKRA